MRVLCVSENHFNARSGQGGQSMVEYGMILALVSLVVLLMLVSTGHQVTNLFSNITATFHQAGL